MSPDSPFLVPSADSDYKAGRARNSDTTIYYSVPGVMFSSAGGAIAMAGGTDYYAPFWVASPIVVDQLAAEVTVAGGTNFRFGLYPADTDLQPAANAAPLADSGNLSSATTGVKTYTPATAIFLPRGRYLTVANSDAAISIRGYAMSTGIDTTAGDLKVTRQRVTRAYAAFPTPGTRWDTISSAATAINHGVWCRVSVP